MNGGWNGFKVRGFETLFKDPPSLTLLEAFEEPVRGFETQNGAT